MHVYTHEINGISKNTPRAHISAIESGANMARVYTVHHVYIVCSTRTTRPCPPQHARPGGGAQEVVITL